MILIWVCDQFLNWKNIAIVFPKIKKVQIFFSIKLNMNTRNDVEHIPTQDGKCVGIKGTIRSTNNVNSKFDI
jgi:hypothetical protein